MSEKINYWKEATEDNKKWVDYVSNLPEDTEVLLFPEGFDDDGIVLETPLVPLEEQIVDEIFVGKQPQTREIQGQKVLTVGELKALLSDVYCTDDVPVVLQINGQFVYATKAEEAIASTWDLNAIWVVTEDAYDEDGEFPVKEAVHDGRMIPVIYIRGGKNEPA